MGACSTEPGRATPLLLAAALAAACAWPVAAPAADDYQLVPYHARYSIYRNTKLTGKVEVSLEKHGERWEIRSESSGTHGLARILAVRDNESTSGLIVDGRFRPDRYFRHTRFAGIDDRWTVQFDWAQQRVSIVNDNKDPLLLDMPPEGAVDPLALKLEMRRLLAGSEPELHFQMVEEDEIDEQNFRILPPEWMETSLGCLRTTVVEKIRHGSKRYTRAWHAPELDFLEVRMEHGKTGGNHLELRITELTVEGVEIEPRPGCAARQTSGEAE